MDLAVDADLASRVHDPRRTARNEPLVALDALQAVLDVQEVQQCVDVAGGLVEADLVVGGHEAKVVARDGSAVVGLVLVAHLAYLEDAVRVDGVSGDGLALQQAGQDRGTHDFVVLAHRVGDVDDLLVADVHVLDILPAAAEVVVHHLLEAQADH